MPSKLLNDHTGEDRTMLFLQACKLGLEGIVSKKLSAPVGAVAGPD